MARVSDTLLHGGGDARHSWPGSTLARNPTQVTQLSNHNYMCECLITLNTHPDDDTQCRSAREYSPGI